MKGLLVICFVILTAIPLLAQRPAYGILVDNTGSMRTQFDRELELAREVVKQLNDGTSISIFRFRKEGGPSKNAVVQAALHCTTDRILLNKTIDELYLLGGQTTLIDAVQGSADVLNTITERCGEYSERNLVLITDGEDRTSVEKLEDLVTSLKSTKTRVFAIGLVGELDPAATAAAKSPQDKAKELLINIAKETGGAVVFPTKDQAASEIVRLMFNPNQRVLK